MIQAARICCTTALSLERTETDADKNKNLGKIKISTNQRKTRAQNLQMDYG
uniref:Uncharacterized protein n=1 Tax=Arundo donax TaxID=35708 RepID=A0A0A9CF77_ARUDO